MKLHGLLLIIWLHTFPWEGKPSILFKRQMLLVKQFFNKWLPPSPFLFPYPSPWLAWLVILWYLFPVGSTFQLSSFLLWKPKLPTQLIWWFLDWNEWWLVKTPSLATKLGSIEHWTNRKFQCGWPTEHPFQQSITKTCPFSKKWSFLYWKNHYHFLFPSWSFFSAG